MKRIIYFKNNRPERHLRPRLTFCGGQAILSAVVFFLVVLSVLLFAVTAPTLSIERSVHALLQSQQSLFLAEGGVEDAVYRIRAGKQISAQETITLGSYSTVTTITTISASEKQVVAAGNVNDYQRTVQAGLSTSLGASFFYGVQIGAGGVTMGSGAQVNGNLSSNGSVDGGRVTGNAIVATGLSLTPTVEWPAGCTSTCGDSDTFFATTTTNQDSAQSFIATASGALNKVSVFLGKVGSPTADITLRITTDVSGNPDSSAIQNGSAVIARTSVGATPSWINAAFATPPNLTNGTKYWIVLDYTTNSTTDYWNWRRDSTDGYANNTGKNTASWSSGSAVWVPVGGDLAFRLWIGGVNTQITNATVNGTARAPAFSNDTVSGAACPPTGGNCIVASDPPQPLSISDGVLQDFRNQAAAGGVVGDQNISGTASLGPTKINGDLNVNGGATLTVTGTLWVTGQFQTSNNATVRLSSAYGTNSGMIIADNTVELSNNVILSGSGQSGSYIMVVAAKNATTSEVLDISNNVAGAIFYAPHGRIHFNNNAGAKEASGYGLDLDNNATVTYESGLQNINFTSGPGGTWKIKSWGEQ